MTVRLVLGLVLLILCVYLGKCYAKKYSDRVCYYTCLISFNEDLSMEANFTRKNLVKLCGKEYKSVDFCDTIKSCIESKIKRTSGNLNLPEYIISERREQILEYFDSIGKYDGKTTEEFCKGYNERFNRYLIDAEKDFNKYNSVCVKLGFLLGLALLITVI